MERIFGINYPTIKSRPTCLATPSNSSKPTPLLRSPRSSSAHGEEISTRKMPSAKWRPCNDSVCSGSQPAQPGTPHVPSLDPAVPDLAVVAAAGSLAFAIRLPGLSVLPGESVARGRRGVADPNRAGGHQHRNRTPQRGNVVSHSLVGGRDEANILQTGVENRQSRIILEVRIALGDNVGSICVHEMNRKLVLRVQMVIDSPDELVGGLGAAP